MKRVVTKGPGGPLAIEPLTEPETRSGEVRVDLRLSCVTQADARFHHDGPADRFPLVQGGSGGGSLATGGGSLLVGTRVVIWPRLACRSCRGCRANSGMCWQPELVGRDRPGTLAAQVVVPRANVVQVPSTLGLAYAAAAAEFADAWKLTRAAAIGSTTRVAVLGDGLTSSRVVRLAEASGAEVLHEPHRADLPPEGFDTLVVEASAAITLGNLDEQVDTVVIHGPAEPAQTLILGSSGLVAAERKVIGCGPAGRQDLVALLRWLAESGHSLEIGEMLSWDRAGEAFDVTREPRPMIVREEEA